MVLIAGGVKKKKAGKRMIASAKRTTILKCKLENSMAKRMAAAKKKSTIADDEDLLLPLESLEKYDLQQKSCGYAGVLVVINIITLC